MRAPQEPLPVSLDEWLGYISTIHSQVIELGLERVGKVYKRLAGQIARQSAIQGLGALHSGPDKEPAEYKIEESRSGKKSKPLVITFAGTNGKGSTLAMVEALALTAGKRVGAYTSPHLRRFNERIRINGADATDDLITSGFAAVEHAREETALTYFEFTTLAAFDVFLKSGLDIWLLEIGLGGRLDAVNIIDPDIAVITTVDLDHQDWLGTDRETIGLEKAGILRKQIPVVLGSTDLPQSVYQKAAEMNANVFSPGDDFNLHDRQFVSARTLGNSQKLTLNLLSIPDLPADNLAAALQLARLTGIDLTCLENSPFPPLALQGRFQVISQHPEIVLDVGHNPHAARYLASWLTRNPVRGPDIAVFSALQDKDVDGVVTALTGSFYQWHLFEVIDPRAMAITQLEATVCNRLNQHSGSFSLYESSAQVISHHSVQEALQQARIVAGEFGRIFVFGSFMTVAAVMETGMIEAC